MVVEKGRELRVVVLGASGVTGSQAVPYLRERAAESGFRWGIAGRSRERLEALVSEWPEEERPELLVGDVADAGAMDELAAATGAVVNFAGPFARMAPKVIEACVGAGTSYVDVTGEIDFAARVIARWHEPARASGARIVQVCGFEALPFDLVAALAIERLAAAGDEPIAIDSLLRASPPPGRPHPSDLVSRGTYESLREALAGEGAEALGDPAALIGDLAAPSEVRAVSPIRSWPRWRSGVGPVAPMLPSPVINPPVIQRSLALAGRRPVRYEEGVAVASMVPSRPAQALVAGLSSAFNGGLGLLARAPEPVRRAGAGAMKVATPAGGPRPERLEGWRWSVACTVRGVDGSGAEARVDAHGHPGYLATSRMTAEAGLMLADPEARVPVAGGVLTPAAALGTAGLERFERAGLTFS